MILISYSLCQINVPCVGVVKQSYSNDGDSLDQRDVLRSSPSRPYRHSVGFVPTLYNGTLPPSKLLCSNEVLCIVPEYVSAFILSNC